MSSYEPPSAPEATACYRHPNRPSGVGCQRCERIICPECMHQASVGVHCPECVSQTKQKVFTPRNLAGTNGTVTNAIIALNVAAFVAQIIFFNATATSAGTTASELAVWGPGIDVNGEWWRIFTSGFLHIGIIHLGMNMYSLYHIGPLLERQLGPLRYGLAYGTSLVGGSFGALLLKPSQAALGASGAIFGLLGLLVILFRSRGISINQSGLGPVLMINLFISLSGYVSLGGHAGGFVVGAALGILYWGLNPGDEPVFGGDQQKPNLATGVLAVVLFVGCLWAAGTWMDPIF